ncbi:MAG: hypothetical protein H8E57_09060 [Candidatus Cloacimonetes bacterium]|nr:hypothetical protein [Candidatus Cloacimonadota bacterium]
MNEFKEEIERRRTDRRKKRSSTWIGLVLRIILLIFVIMIMRFLATPKAEITTEILLHPQEQNEIQKDEK